MSRRFKIVTVPEEDTMFRRRPRHPVIDDEAVLAVSYILGLLTPLLVRKCRGCTDTSPHSYHLTRFGCWCFSLPAHSGPQPLR